jgi:hypothetical protein
MASMTTAACCCTTHRREGRDSAGPTRQRGDAGHGNRGGARLGWLDAYGRGRAARGGGDAAAPWSHTGAHEGTGEGPSHAERAVWWGGWGPLAVAHQAELSGDVEDEAGHGSTSSEKRYGLGK